MVVVAKARGFDVGEGWRGVVSVGSGTKETVRSAALISHRHLSVRPSVYLSIYLSTYLPIPMLDHFYLLTRLRDMHRVCLFVCLCAHITYAPKRTCQQIEVFE